MRTAISCISISKTEIQITQNPPVDLLFVFLGQNTEVAEMKPYRHRILINHLRKTIGQASNDVSKFQATIMRAKNGKSRDGGLTTFQF